jgi:hypothetical protein
MESDFKDLIQFEPGTHDLTADAIELIATVAAQKRDIDRAEKLIKAKLLGVMGANAVSKFECDRISAALVTPASKPREELDVEGLTRDFPEIVAAYTRKVEGDPKAPYIKITVREV